MWARAVTTILGFLANLFSKQTMRYFALKSMIVLLFTIVLPYVLKSVLIWFVLEIKMRIVGSALGEVSAQTAIVQLTGITGFFAHHLMLPQIFSLFVTAFVTRMTLKQISMILG